MILPLWLSGYRRVTGAASSVPVLLNLLRENHLPFRAFAPTPEGGVTFLCSRRSAEYLRARCAGGEEVAFSELLGLPAVALRFLPRLGLILGGICGAVLIFLSSTLIWRVECVGNERVSYAEIVDLLAQNGVFVGARIDRLEPSVVETSVLLSSDRLSWISLTFDGTVARVQVIEAVIPPGKEVLRPANLVAECDGQIEYLELYRGESVVRSGQAVRRGELLVSGISDSPTLGYRFTRAAGRVMARVEEEITVEVPFRSEEKVKTREQVSEITLHFFHFSIKLFKNSGNEEGVCDIINRERVISLPGGKILPVSVTQSVRVGYETVSRTLDEESAVREAFAGLEEKMKEISRDRQLLSKESEIVITPTSVILHCRVRVLRDIAQTLEFEIDETI